eukprot:1155366-Pelagomonas_calceolata.AAC.4
MQGSVLSGAGVCLRAMCGWGTLCRLVEHQLCLRARVEAQTLKLLGMSGHESGMNEVWGKL